LRHFESDVKRSRGSSIAKFPTSPSGGELAWEEIDGNLSGESRCPWRSARAKQQTSSFRGQSEDANGIAVWQPSLSWRTSIQCVRSRMSSSAIEIPSRKRRTWSSFERCTCSPIEASPSSNAASMGACQRIDDTRERHWSSVASSSLLEAQITAKSLASEPNRREDH